MIGDLEIIHVHVKLRRHRGWPMPNDETLAVIIANFMEVLPAENNRPAQIYCLEFGRFSWLFRFFSNKHICKQCGHEHEIIRSYFWQNKTIWQCNQYYVTWCPFCNEIDLLEDKSTV